MSKVSDAAARAFLGGRSFKGRNTTVTVIQEQSGGEVVTMRLHNNIIAERNGRGDTWIQNSWVVLSRTTKNRYGAIGIEVVTKAGRDFLTGVPWAGYRIKTGRFRYAKIHEGVQCAMCGADDIGRLYEANYTARYCMTCTRSAVARVRSGGSLPRQLERMVEAKKVKEQLDEGRN